MYFILAMIVLGVALSFWAGCFRISGRESQEENNSRGR